MNTLRITIFTFLLAFLFIGCEKRTCRCDDDLHLTWANDKKLENIDVLVPNAVLISGDALAIRIDRIDEPVVWKLQRVKIQKGNNIFIDSYAPGEFRKDEVTMEFPQHFFDELSTGAVSVEIEVEFFENARLKIEGTIFYYACEDIGNEFELEDCRWPNQILDPHEFIWPC